MQMSARILGDSYGLTAEEMNRVLVKLGFLEGKPGDYSMTEKALPFGIEKEHHRGKGGYPSYNRYWDTRTFDDSIKNELDVTDEIVQQVREELKAVRAARSAARAAEIAEANASYLKKQLAEEAAEKAKKFAEIKQAKRIESCKKAGKVILIIGGTAATIYVIYKLVPKIKKRWKDCKWKTKIAKGKEKLM